MSIITGPIFSLNLAGQPVIVVNDFTTAADLVGEFQFPRRHSRCTYLFDIPRSSLRNLQ